MTLRGETGLSGDVIAAAIAVHRELGPGLEEPQYEMALATQLKRMRIPHFVQFGLPLRYKGVVLDCGYRIDLLVDNRLVVECKSVEWIHPIHEAQLLTYLRLSGREIGLLINFDVAVLKDGIRRKIVSEEMLVRPNLDSASIDEHACHDVDDLDDALTETIIAAAMEVHRHLGPGLLRSSYEECLSYELSQRRVAFRRKHGVKVRFHDVELPGVLAIPVLVNDSVPVLCLSVSQITPLHVGQMRTMLKQGQWDRGLVVNFNTVNLSRELRRVTR
jgi:GxxExxY protein